MNTYEFKSKYGNYTFSDSQIESNKYLSREQKEIMHGLALNQSRSYAPRYYAGVDSYYSKPATTSKYWYDVYENGKDKARELVKTPAEYTIEADLTERRWYETISQFATRKAKEFEKRNTVKVKEVKRENINIERSTFADGTQISKWNNNIKLF